MSDVKKDAEKLEEVFDNLTQSIQDAATTSNKLRETFLELSKSGTAAGNAWTVISRLTSGTGFWRIQNRVRAISNFLQFQDKRAEAIAESENKAIKRLAKQVKLKKDIDAAEKLLQKVINDTATSEERVTFYKSEQYKYLEQIMGPTKALEEMQNRIENASAKLALTDKDMLNNRVKNFKNLLKQGQSYRNIIFGTIDAQSSDEQLRRFNAITDEQQRTFMQYIDSHGQKEKLEKDLAKLREENDDKIAQSVNEQIALEQEKIELEEKQQLMAIYGIDNYSERIEDLKEELKIKEDLIRLQEQEKASGEGKFIDEITNAQTEITNAFSKLTNEGITVSMQDGGKIIQDPPQQKFMKKMIGKVTGFLDKIPGGNLITGIFRGMAKFHKDHPTMKDKMAKAQEMFKGFARLAMRMLRGMFMWIPLLIFGLMALKEAGFFDMVSNFISVAGRFLFNIYQGIIEIFIVIGDLFGATIAFIGALFNGNSGEAWAALQTILYALKDLFIAFIELFFVDILWGLVTLFFEGLFGHYFKEGVDKFDSIASAVYDLVLLAGAIKIFMMALPFSLPAAIVAGFASLLFGAKVKNWLLGLVGLDGAMANGGMVNKSGSYLVGERGPEIVNLKAGNYVTPNNQLGGMTNNITVNVNGRLGASDTELNDIANKLSRKISLEMQRTSPTGIYR
tara:strand:+ start:80 stop:2116 length:2037 start_codon:yes stop_codon:yes gene_type:complete